MNLHQEWSAESYARNARFVADHAAPLLEILDPQPGERILDLGCGDGVLTAKIAQSGASVIGIDTSAELLNAARNLGTEVLLMDGQHLEFDEEFDAVFTNAALHWMPDGAGVLRGVAGILAPGGRFVGEFGGHGNIAAILTAVSAALKLHRADYVPGNPWFFPTAEEYGAMLEAHGFQIDEIGLNPRPTLLPTGITGWLNTFAAPLLAGLDAERRAMVTEYAAELLAPSLRDAKGNWTADYVRLRFEARKRQSADSGNAVSDRAP